MSIRNGMPAADLTEVSWRKSRGAARKVTTASRSRKLPTARWRCGIPGTRGGPAVFTAAEWAAFVGGARDGDFD